MLRRRYKCSFPPMLRSRPVGSISISQIQALSARIEGFTMSSGHLMTIIGLHHITLVCADAQRTIDFYTQILGQRLVKQTVNFDDPSSYHLYFGDEIGRPGTAITFFEWRGAKKGHPGVGGTHHFAMQVADYDTQLKWKRWLTDHQIKVDGPFDRHYFTSIYFHDPDGTILEIATIGPGWTRDEDPDKIGMEYREPPPQMLVNNRDEERIKAETWP